MKKPHILPALAFLGVCAFAVIIAWLTGYNFDKRGDDIAFGFFMTTLYASMLAGLVYALTSGEL